MVKQLDADNIARIVSFLEENKGEDVSLTDIMSLAEVMADSLDSFLSAMDKSIYREFTSIAQEISSMKEEIALLAPVASHSDRIPDAGRELDAVVEATETATNTIMGAAEAIMGADTSDQDAYQAEVNDKVIEIFEACSFQDITGQRISKVVEVLNVIDERVTSFVDRMGVQTSNMPCAKESEAERRRRELILHGPQHEGEGVDQSEVDAMLADMVFGSEDSKSQEEQTNLEIDKLFP